MDSLVGKLALGTVQFGLDYGVANEQGKVSYADIRRIMKTAFEAGITTLDTAVAYGDSEAVIGSVGCENFSVVTKLPEVPPCVTDVDGWVEEQIRESLNRLNITQLDGLLLHRPEQLNSNMGGNLYKALYAAKNRGAAKRIGISVYEPSELDLLPKEYTFDLVQAPFNPFDQRLLTTGWLENLSAVGTAVHLRSIFLQGLLLMKQHERPSKFLPWQKTFNHWNTWLEETGQSALEACLSHAVNLPSVEKVVVGINSPQQLSQIVNALGDLSPGYNFNPIIDDLRILNPAKWGDL